MLAKLSKQQLRTMMSRKEDPSPAKGDKKVQFAKNLEQGPSGAKKEAKADAKSQSKEDAKAGKKEKCE